MARALKNADLDTRAARSKLKARGKPHWWRMEDKLHLGYRKPKGRPGQSALAGKWVVRVYVGDRRYETKSLATADDYSDANGRSVLSFTQAQQRARAERDRLVGAADRQANPVTVREAVEAYIDFLTEHRKSAQDARYRADAFILPALGHLEVNALTSKQLRRWHSDLAKAPPRVRTKEGETQQFRDTADDDEAKRRRRSTANRILTVLKAALNHAWAEHENAISSDAAWRRVKAFKEADAARVRYLSMEESRRLINGAGQDLRPLVRAALLTGCRYGELARLTVADFNAQAGTVSVRQSKSSKARHVVLTEEGTGLFKQACAGRLGSDLIFQRANGEPWGKSQQSRPMIEACKAAKISPPISIHGLRHTWASHAVMNGVPLFVVAKNLGHSDTRMVEKHYGHIAPSYLADTIRKGAPQFGFEPDDKVVEIRAR